MTPQEEQKLQQMQKQCGIVMWIGILPMALLIGSGYILPSNIASFVWKYCVETLFSLFVLLFICPSTIWHILYNTGQSSIVHSEAMIKIRRFILQYGYPISILFTLVAFVYLKYLQIPKAPNS